MFSAFMWPVLQVDVLLSVMVVGMEKLIEGDFICHCGDNNHSTVVGLLTCSSIIISSLTVLIQLPRYKKLLTCPFRCTSTRLLGLLQFIAGVLLSLAISLLTWLTVWYYDGHYYVCQQSHWNGTWSVNSEGLPRRWCKPNQDNQTAYEEQRMLSVKWFIESQVTSAITV